MLLPVNGFRLRFDGPDQRLRLIEVLDFSKTSLVYKELDLVKLPGKTEPPLKQTPSGSVGPPFRHVYDRLFGPTFPGVYVAASDENEGKKGVYILSYPGVAFTFPLQRATWSSEEDFVSVLSSSAVVASSMAIFEGQSWPEASQDLMDRPCTNPRSLALSSRGKEFCPDEVEVVRIYGRGKIDLERRNSPVFHILLSETTPQDLITELGPPDMIHRKYDRRLSIHRSHNRHPRSRRTFSENSTNYYEETTDTDLSSTHAVTDDSDEDDEPQGTRNGGGNRSQECFYNYFHHGFDIFISYPTHASPAIPPGETIFEGYADEVNTSRLVATKILLHANAPGSYPFNRYRRSRWVIHAQDPEQDVALTSETPFGSLSDSLQHIWHNGFANGSSKDSAQKAMILNRDWGDSPGSSCEILGDWEESADSSKKDANGPNGISGTGLGNTKLYGFPGLLFEVLKNDAVSCLTVY